MLDDVEVAVAAVGEGARVVRERVGGSIERIDKGGGDFATSADIEAEWAILALLDRERPDDAVVAEESGAGGLVGASRTWLIDPLCGTLNHAVQMRVVAVNVALRCGDAVVCAAVADPFSGEVFWTAGGDAFVRVDHRDTVLTPSPDSGLVDLNFDPPFPSAPAFRAVVLAGDPEFAASFRPRVVSSSLALTWAATGRRAAYVTDGDIRGSVHFSAGLAICEAAGCVISDLTGQAWGQAPHGAIVAADRETHTTLLALVHKQRSP